MTSSPDRDPATRRSTRCRPRCRRCGGLCKLGYRHEPRLMVAAFVLSQLAALPDALLALWLMLLGKGVLEQQARPGARRGDWPRRVDRRDVVSPHGQHARAAPLPRQGDDRARVARRATAGIDRDDRASGAPGVSRSAVDAPQSGVRARPHVHVAVFHARVDPAPGRDDGAAGVDSSGAHPARRRSRVPTVLTSTWRPAVERVGAGARRTSQPAGASPVHHRHDRAARKGSAGHRHRRAPRDRAPGGVGALVRTGGDRAVGLGVVARAGVGDIRPRHMSARSCSCRPASARRRARCCWCSPQVRGCRRTSAPRSARSDSCADSGWTARGGSRGSRTTPLPSRRPAICRCPPRCTAASVSTTCRSPTRARHASCWTMCR